MSSLRQRARAAVTGRDTSVAIDPHGFGVGFGGDRKARFDDVHAERVELPRQLELLGHAQREARRLLAVAQGGVEDDDTVSSHEASAFDFRIAVTMQSSL